MTPPRVHVAIVLPAYARLIVEGKKRAEARLGRDRRAPFGAVDPGDVIYFKERSGGYAARAIARRVVSRELGSARGVAALRRECDADVRGAPEFWRSKRGARNATVIWFDSVVPVAEGPDLSRFVRPGCRNAWHVVPGAVALAA